MGWRFDEEKPSALYMQTGSSVWKKLHSTETKAASELDPQMTFFFLQWKHSIFDVFLQYEQCFLRAEMNVMQVQIIFFCLHVSIPWCVNQTDAWRAAGAPMLFSLSAAGAQIWSQRQTGWKKAPELM